MAFATVCIRYLCFVALFMPACARDFLSQQVTRQLVKETLLAELTSSAGNARIAAIEQELLPMFASMPQNQEGEVESSVVTYLLHRYFVQKHGWYVKGLSPFTYRTSLDETTTGEFITELAPAYIQELLMKQMKHEGMQLRDLAVFAATMADLIHAEGMRNLFTVYEKLGMSTDEADAVDFFRALRGYLSAIIIGFDTEVTANIPALERQARSVYPEYDDLIMWIEDTQLDIRFLDRSHRNPFRVRDGISFDEADRLMHALYHHFGTLLNRECMSVKEELVDQEYPNTGRVPLAKFYARVDSNLKESVDYIRNMGALDETDPSNPTLVIPNYMSSPARCMPFSSYFSVCCPDTCESIRREVEVAVAEPVAEPQRIAEIVSGISSETQDAPRNLSSLLLSRLEDIGRHHGGHVPLHGRLFMQWMHHAYPRECPYPHASGTVNPVSQEEWILLHDELDDAMVSDAEKEAHMSKELLPTVGLEHLPWTDVEELVAAQDMPGAVKRSFFRPCMMVIAVLSFALPLSRASAAMLRTRPEDKTRMHFV